MKFPSLWKILVGFGVLMLLVGLSYLSQSISTAEHDRYSTDLLQLKETDSKLNEELLRTRYGLTVSFDALNLRLHEIEQLRQATLKVPAYIDREGKTEINESLKLFSDALKHKETLLQQFKSENAVYRNSTRYFPLAARERGAKETIEIKLALNALLEDVLLFTHTSERELAKEISRKITTLTTATKDPDLEALLSHARIIIEEKPKLDTLTQEIIAADTDNHADRAIKLYNQYYEFAQQSSSFYRLCLYLLSTALLGLIILRLRSATLGLRDVQASLELEVQQRTKANQSLQTEIADRKHAEAQLGEAQKIAQLGSWEFNAETKQLKWSDEEFRRFGYEPNEFDPTIETFLEHVHPDDREFVSDSSKGWLKDNLKFSMEYRIVRKDGTVRVIQGNGKPSFNEHGKLVTITGTSQDITDRKEIEEQLRQARDGAMESARLKSEFLANMSHEIRTPMNGVIGMTGLLLDTELTSEQRDFAETIRNCGDALLTVINDILDFSKIEAGKLHFEILDFDLRQTVEDSVELLAESALNKKIEIASLVNCSVPSALRGDPGRVRQVLTNLIGNAVKFTEHGEVFVSAETETEDEKSAVIRFTVRDTGIGINPTAQKNLFQAFTQADGSTTRKYGGTGLGLSISKQLVALMGGQIGVDSTHGEGSSFWFTARFDKQDEQKMETASPASLKDLRVLIVDDNATNRKIITHQTLHWGMKPFEASSASEALSMLGGNQKYDVIMSDLMMPDMDGFELARQIKANPSVADVPLMMLTSFREREHTLIAKEIGIKAYLTKPIRQSQLFASLNEVMSVERSKAPTKPSPRAKPAELQHSARLILLAEDNIVNQKLAIHQLQKLGYRADAVANGREAVEALSRISYDLVLMDCQMPEMDGYQATAEIRRREGTLKHTPIVAMTANALEGDREKCLSAGMDEYISKPVKQQQLAAVLTTMFDEELALSTR